MTTPNYTIDQYSVVRLDDTIIPQDESSPLYQDLLVFLQGGGQLTQITSDAPPPEAIPLNDYKVQKSSEYMQAAADLAQVAFDAQTPPATTNYTFSALLTVTKHQQLARINIIATTSNDGVDIAYAAAIDALTADLAAIST